MEYGCKCELTQVKMFQGHRKDYICVGEPMYKSPTSQKEAIETSMAFTRRSPLALLLHHQIGIGVPRALQSCIHAITVPHPIAQPLDEEQDTQVGTEYNTTNLKKTKS